MGNKTITFWLKSATTWELPSSRSGCRNPMHKVSSVTWPYEVPGVNRASNVPYRRLELLRPVWKTGMLPLNINTAYGGVPESNRVCSAYEADEIPYLPPAVLYEESNLSQRIAVRQPDLAQDITP